VESHSLDGLMTGWLLRGIALYPNVPATESQIGSPLSPSIREGRSQVIFWHS
jgi:hypothetical protein